MKVSRCSIMDIMAPTQRKTEHFPLVDLPPEIRAMVYEAVSETEGMRFPPSLCAVSRGIRSEYLPIYISKHPHEVDVVVESPDHDHVSLLISWVPDHAWSRVRVSGSLNHDSVLQISFASGVAELNSLMDYLTTIRFIVYNELTERDLVVSIRPRSLADQTKDLSERTRNGVACYCTETEELSCHEEFKDLERSLSMEFQRAFQQSGQSRLSSEQLSTLIKHVYHSQGVIFDKMATSTAHTKAEE